MKYQITVPEMHCTGCDGLMKVTLEDYFSEVKPDHMTHLVKFESDKNEWEVKLILERIFEEFKNSEPNYTYVELIEIK